VDECKPLVSGARKLEVWIRGAADVLPTSGLTPHPAGYLVADVTSGAGSQAGAYTRPLFSSTCTVSDIEYPLYTP